MAPRGASLAPAYGLHHLLDQASVISLSKGDAPVVPRRHPSPSPEIGGWCSAGGAGKEALPAAKPALRSLRFSDPDSDAAGPLWTEHEEAAESPSLPSSEAGGSDAGRDWAATWHSRDVEMWQDRVSPRKARSSSPGSKTEPPREPGRKAEPPREPGRKAAGATEEVGNEMERKRSRSRPGGEGGASFQAKPREQPSPGRRNGGHDSHDGSAHEKAAMAGSASPMPVTSTTASQLARRSRRQSAGRRNVDRPASLSGRQPMTILGRGSVRAASSGDSGSASVSPEVSSGSSGASGVPLEDTSGRRGEKGNWRQWTKELAAVLDESQKVSSTSMSRGHSLLSLTSDAAEELIRSRDSGSRRIVATSLLRSISLDRGIGEGSDELPLSGLLSKERAEHSPQSLNGGLSQSLAGSRKGHSLGRSVSPNVAQTLTGALARPRFISPPMHHGQALNRVLKPTRSDSGIQTSKEFSRKEMFPMLRSIELQDVASVGLSHEDPYSTRASVRKAAGEKESTAWYARREESQMKASLKVISSWLELEGAKLVGRMPMSTREMALVMSQVAEGMEEQMDAELGAFSMAGERSLRKSVETLLEVFERQVAKRNDRGAQVRSQQVMQQALDSAELLLDEAITSHRESRSKKRLTAQDILPNIRQQALSRFRVNVSSFLAKPALQRLQDELVQKVEQMAEVMVRKEREYLQQQLR